MKLLYFIAYALHRTKLHPSVVFVSLVLLQRLKARFPTAQGSPGHRLFVLAFMLAHKVICDNAYWRRQWCWRQPPTITQQKLKWWQLSPAGYVNEQEVATTMTLRYDFPYVHSQWLTLSLWYPLFYVAGYLYLALGAWYKHGMWFNRYRVVLISTW